jgi:maltooligosyltrehalose trehalohydrolase
VELLGLRVGADFQDGVCRFVVWAPNHRHLKLVLPTDNQHLSMDRVGGGYWTYTGEGFESDTIYMFGLDGKEVKPDPASHYQPDGVFGSSMIVDHDSFRWQDRDWRGLEIKDLVFYELHVGTFTDEGSFLGVIERVKELADFGVNAIELMPIAQFSGKRNWGYDGVFPFAVQNSYGRPDDLKKLVNECHLNGMALFVDFVYNHLGPEGNCLNCYAPYFPETSVGRWGANLNLDGLQNEGVRNYFLENTLHWFSHYHIDGIRLDSVLSMHDSSPKHFLVELNEYVKRYADATGFKVHLVAETGYNVPALLAPLQEGGCGFEAQWLEDFQHALFALLTGEREGYYKDFGSVQDVAEVLTDGYVYVGNIPRYRRRKPGESLRWINADRFIVFSQNHDQVGNRLKGDRLITIAGFEAAKLAAGIVLLSPYVPLLFMGEEFGETSPFLFFVDYEDKELAEAVRVGRKREFEHFHWQGEVPDPLSMETFEKSKLDWQKRYSERGLNFVSYYRMLLKLRRRHPVFKCQPNRQIRHVQVQDDVLFIHKESGNEKAGIIANCAAQPVNYSFPFEDNAYIKILDSADCKWAGQGSTLPFFAVKGDDHHLLPFNFAVFLKDSKEGKSFN